jgi:hypothetical protein
MILTSSKMKRNLCLTLISLLVVKYISWRQMVSLHSAEHSLYPSGGVAKKSSEQFFSLNAGLSEGGNAE